MIIKEVNMYASNPLNDLISDEVYNTLNSNNFINEKSVRNHIIRKKYRKLRLAKISSTEAISSLREEYPYLQFDTIRKIVYNIQ